MISLGYKNTFLNTFIKKKKNNKAYFRNNNNTKTEKNI